MGAGGHRIRRDVVGRRDGFQGIPRMAWLSAAFFAAGPAQGLGPWLFDSVTGGRLAAVAAVLGQLILERLDSGFEGANGCHQRGDQGLNSLLTLLVS